VTTKRIGKSILEKTLTRWPVFVDHFNNAMLDEFKKIDAVNRSWDLSKEELASILSTAPRSF
ncbi:hypothetical protein RNM91_25785, partial [Escherichia coli]|nr:hypothetical protein [Escherichia coli]